MNKKKHIKLWVIEKYNQYSKERKSIIGNIKFSSKL